MRRRLQILLGSVAFVLASCATLTAPDYKAIIASPDRAEADRAVDKRRNVEQLLAFASVRPGMRVLEMGAGGGYTAELLARIVGPTGTVYAHDFPGNLPRILQAYDERAKKPIMKDVVRLLRPFDDPLPPGTGNVDLITFLFSYHDTTFLEVDRVKMNRVLFNALKPGGRLIIADHSAAAGAGIGVAKTLHRIEEGVLRREIEAAGFKLEAEANFLRSPGDPRNERVFQPKVPVDEFVLRYVKP